MQPQCLLQREAGCSWFRRSFRESIAQRLTLQSSLQFHDGCVNTLSFCSDGRDSGRWLISGSDDFHVAIWDWQCGVLVMSFNTGHFGNVFQAKSLGDAVGLQKIASCGADGQVLMHEIKEGCSTDLACARLYRHSGRVHKLAMFPANPNVFMSAGEDGRVVLYDVRERNENMIRPILLQHQRANKREALYSIHVNPIKPEQFCIGGTSGVVRIFDIRAPISTEKPRAVCQLVPKQLLDLPSGLVSVTSSIFSKDGSILVSLSDDDIYLFHSNSILKGSCLSDSDQRFYNYIGLENNSRHNKDYQRCQTKSRGWYHSACVSCSTGDSLTTFSSLDGSARDVNRETSVVQVRYDGEQDILSSDDTDGIERYDRFPFPFHVYEQEDSHASVSHTENSRDSSSSSESDNEDAESSWYDSSDDSDEDLTNICLIGNQDKPWINVGISTVFRGHRNEMTVKGAAFLGLDEEFVVSGSDCGHIYIWDRKFGTLVTTFKGEKHVVNCIEPHPQEPFTMATSGIEEDIKIWSPISDEPLILSARDIARANSNQRNKGKSPVVTSSHMSNDNNWQ